MATIFGTNGADALLRGTDTADAIFGLWGDDSIEGVQGRDFLYGGNGNDTLDGGAGNDVIDGGGHFDLVLYTSNTTSVWADLRSGLVSFPGQGWPAETVLNVEALDGGSARDTFLGNGAANLFWGNAGNDRLEGNFGSDTLIGGIGADSLDGGNGPDSLVGGYGDDTMRGGLHDDIFGVGPSVGSDADGNPVLNDWGSDTYDGGGGSDTLYVVDPVYSNPDDSNGDPVSDGSPPAATVDLSEGSLTFGGGSASTLVSIENVELGAGNDSVTGSVADNYVDLGEGANATYGDRGNDTILGGFQILDDGGAGEGDILRGGAGDDYIDGRGASIRSFNGDGYDLRPGTDVLVGGGGNDTLQGGPAFQSMTGGNGDDRFILTDERVTDGPEDSALQYIAGTTITDFDPRAEVIEFVTAESAVTITGFVGEIDSWEDLAPGEVGYFRNGADTVVQAMFEDSEPDVLTVVLTDFSSALSSNDFGLN